MTTAILAILASSLFAAPPKATKPVTQQYVAAPQKIIYEDEPVIGDLAQGDGSDVVAGPAKKFQSLVKPRTSFVPELVDSARR